jgi:hypothetical protein
MVSIRSIFEQALATGYLTVAAEEQLRFLLRAKAYEAGELSSFVNLQRSILEGQIKQESRDLNRSA